MAYGLRAIAGIRPGFFTFVGYCGCERRFGAGAIMASSVDRGRIGGAATGRAHACVLSVAVALVAAGLAGCGTISEETAAKAAFAPGHFDLYTCKDLAERTDVVHRRQVELEQLMARAEQGAGGAIASAIAYRSDYLQARGELVELNKMSNDKQCAIGNKYSSGRAVF
jgi:hypothetical protein